jgi:hypothetical protein
MHTKLQWKSLKEKYNLGDPAVDVRIVLKCNDK